jgi:uncharacterized protein (TIGR01777 family)
MKILISGGSGLVGSYLIKLLLDKGHEVINLSTRNIESTTPRLTHIQWNPEKHFIPENAFQGIDGVVNLAGFNVANRWTEANKALMTSSRMNSTHLLVEKIMRLEHKPKVFVSASAVGIYKSSLEMQSEVAEPAHGFLADLTSQWEEASATLESELRRCVLRIGVVLDKHDGAVAKMIPFFKMGLGSATGSGLQYMSWIHLHDLASMFVYALENNHVKGIYNATAPVPATNHAFSKCLAETMHKPFFLPAVPGFALKLLFGEMATMLLNSQRISSKKIEDAGFVFRYRELKPALSQLFS